jgi:hypothetical protein
VGWVRAAFDPAAAPALAAAAPHDLAWADAAPVAAEERWDSYRCDSGVSVSWGWDEAPRSAVSSDVLTRLIAPGGWPKRVTLLITPMPAARAARELQMQSQAALFRSQVKIRSGREESAREWADRERAMQAAAEEAQGAGVVDIQVYVTTTVGDESLLAAACADVEHRAEESRLRLRRLFGSQSVGFAAGLSCGIKPELLRGR